MGAGPCGARYAIETQLLGGRATVIEKRTSFTRNNVLHLWPFVIEDLKALGTKQFFPKFCTGSMNHISKFYIYFFKLLYTLAIFRIFHEFSQIYLRILHFFDKGHYHTQL